MDMLSEIINDITAWFHKTLFTIGIAPVDLLGLLRVLIILAVAWWVSKAVRLTINRIAVRWQGMSQSSVYTLGRVIHYAILTLGLVIGLSSIGIDLSNLTLMVGALGVGIGFGLQAIFSNFISGLIILFEKSLKIGDFVELESGVVGEVREINIRSTRITTNDNIDILVPNSEFVNGRVINWTLDEANRRIRVPFGVAYGTDKENVRAAVLQAAHRVPYTLRDGERREPRVELVKFGDSSLDFELVVWITAEAVKRPQAVQAAYLWEIHTALQENGIEIPFPQRDINLRTLFGMKDDEARKWLGQSREVGRTDSRDADKP
jgi:potassium-dependent mechanosensitive channel